MSPQHNTITVAGDYESLGQQGTRFRIFAPPGVQTRTAAAGTLDSKLVSAESSRCLYAGYRYESPLAGIWDGSAAQHRQTGTNFAGQHYTLHRHYDPVLMRFTSPDPAAQFFFNLHSYGKNNPGRFYDPDGDFILLLPALATFAIAGAAIAFSADAAVQYSEHSDKVESGETTESFAQSYDAERGAKWGGVGAGIGVATFHVLGASLFAWELAPAAANFLLQAHISGTAGGGGTGAAILARLWYGSSSGTTATTSTIPQRAPQVANGVSRISQTYSSSANSGSGTWTVSVRGSSAATSANRSWTGIAEQSRSVTRTNAQLVQDIANRAEAWGVRKGLSPTGHVSGTLKHGHAERLLYRYQRMLGDRGLTAEARYVNGVPWREGMPTKGSVRLDVVEGPLNKPAAVYDYKFGNAKLTPSRVRRIRAVSGIGPQVPMHEVKPR